MSQSQEMDRVLISILKEKFPQAIDVKIKPVSSDGANYASMLYEAAIVTQDETIDIFAKALTIGDKITDSNQTLITEEFMYTTISKAYNELQDIYGIAEKLTFPKCYAISEADGIVVLENLVSKGYECYDRLKSIDWKYGSKCVETLAQFHALSFALRKEYPDVFKLAEETLGLPILALTDPGWKGLADAALAAVDDSDREILSKLLEDSVGWSKMKEMSDTRETPVIIHGDYRASNLMHKEVNDDLHVIPVDYQTARLGCPASDLIYFIVMGTDQQFRRQHYLQLVDHYYQQLALAMTRLGLVPEELYGREEFESDMKAKLPAGLCTAALALPFVTVDPAHAPSFDLGQFVPRANQLFERRFRELMQDFKLWGVI